MALSDLAVFTDYVYETMTEVTTQQVELFNAASENAILLQAAPMVGDFSDAAHWAKISGLVRRRNPYGTGTVAEKALTMLVDTMVKVAAGTPPVRIDPGMFNWIQRSPEEAGIVIGQQLAGDTLGDMLNTALLAVSAGISGVSALNIDRSTAILDFPGFNAAQAAFGDRSQELRAWVMHSKPLFDLYGTALANSTGLFTGTGLSAIQVRRDPFGRLFVITDSPSLVIPGTPNKYKNLGLVTGAVRVDTNGDFTDNVSTVNGNENIVRSWQAEWSYNVGLKGMTWDKTNGGKAPTDAALGTATNWDRTATSVKDLPGVNLLTQ